MRHIRNYGKYFLPLCCYGRGNEHRHLDAQISRRMLVPYTEHLGNLLIQMDEIWKPVLGYEGLYEVSNHEEVRSIERIVRHKDGKVSSKPGCLIKKRLNKKRSTYQFYQVDLCRDSVKRTFHLSHLVCEAFHGPRPKGYQCMHLDGNPKNNKPENLAWGTIHENSNEPIRRSRLSEVATGRFSLYWENGYFNSQLKPVLQYSKSGELIAEYSCIRDAERKTGIDHITISRACRGILKTSGGYIWKYKTN